MTRKVDVIIPEEKRKNDSFGFIYPSLAASDTSSQKEGDLHELLGLPHTHSIVYFKSKRFREITEFESLSLYGWPKVILKSAFEKTYSKTGFWVGDETRVNVVVVGKYKDFSASSEIPKRKVTTPRYFRPSEEKKSKKVTPRFYPEGTETNTKIESFIFQGKRYYVKSWKEVLFEVCELMFERHPEQFDRVLKIRGRKRIYFSKILDDISVKPEKIRGTDIYVETNFSSPRQAKVSKQVITLFGYGEEDLSFECYQR